MPLFAIITMIIIIVAIRVAVISIFFCNEFDYKRQIMCRTVVIHISLKGETQQKLDINGTNRNECFCNEPWVRFLLKIFKFFPFNRNNGLNDCIESNFQKSINEKYIRLWILFQVLSSEQSIATGMIYA